MWWMSSVGKLQMIWCGHCFYIWPGKNYFGQNVPLCDLPYSLPHLIVARLLREVLRYWGAVDLCWVCFGTSNDWLLICSQRLNLYVVVERLWKHRDIHRGHMVTLWYLHAFRWETTPENIQFSCSRLVLPHIQEGFGSSLTSTQQEYSGTYMIEFRKQW